MTLAYLGNHISPIQKKLIQLAFKCKLPTEEVLHKTDPTSNWREVYLRLFF